MPLLTDLTTAQIALATKTQFATNVKAQVDKMVKRELVELVLGTLIISDTPICKYCKDGQIESQVETLYDAETGTKTGGKVTTWTYYKTGEVDTITISQRDVADKETAKTTIKHHTDGRQPTESKEAAKEVVVK